MFVPQNLILHFVQTDVQEQHWKQPLTIVGSVLMENDHPAVRTEENVFKRQTGSAEKLECC